jgi:hypothetical protein
LPSDAGILRRARVGADVDHGHRDAFRDVPETDIFTSAFQSVRNGCRGFGDGFLRTIPSDFRAPLDPG